MQLQVRIITKNIRLAYSLIYRYTMLLRKDLILHNTFLLTVILMSKAGNKQSRKASMLENPYFYVLGNIPTFSKLVE